jgi:hypothetical protein
MSNRPVLLSTVFLLALPLHAQQLTALSSTTPLPDAPSTALATAKALTLATTISVKANASKPMEPQPISTHEITGQRILQSAGTFGDLPRYLQTLPGLIGGSDATNASFVRGGNSFESLYTIDRIEVPNINHLALANSTGGLGSMLDTEFIATATFHSGDMSSAFEPHLSSLTEIRTLELPQRPTYSVDLGYTGGGFRINRPLGPSSAVLFSARESVTNLFIKNVGLNGSPEFTNSFSKYTWDPSSTDHVWVESLFGRDELAVSPDPRDPWETNAYDTDYSGWRNTTGVVWQHTYNSDAIGTWTLSNSEDTQKLSQRNQLDLDTLLFRQNNHDGQSNMKYQFLTAIRSGSNTELGVDFHLNRINYNVAQPAGVFSPYSGSRTPQGAFSTTPRFHTLDEAVYSETTLNLLKRLVVRGGVRMEMWGYKPNDLTPPAAAYTPGSFDVNTGGTIPHVQRIDSRALLPHASLSLLAGKSINLRVSIAQYAELPPYATIASQPQNAYLGLIHSQHLIAGGSVRISRYVSADAEVYRKTYSGYPVSTLYPQVSLASMLPTITEPFSLLAMTSAGKGLAHGLEVSVKQAPWHHIFTEANVSFSRAQFTGLDGVYRSGMADLPVVLNVTGGFEVRKFLINVRETAASGRPYTPVLPLASFWQDRLVYDLTKLNALRGDLYNRTDIAVNREILVHGHVMRLHGGILNVFNRQNFFEELWRSRRSEIGAIQEPSMGLQPDFGMGYAF